ncbi:MAG: lipid-binding SYLF domain-containing protein [Nitrospira sp.]|nr:lipid-binding SYLF domain-containing protein [Nitrospira sp.]
MKSLWKFGYALLCIVALAGCQSTGGVAGKSSAAAQIDREVDNALSTFFESNPEAEMFRKEAKAILVFPSVVKGGLMVGAHYGKGALRQQGQTVGYYNTIAASYGLQAGIQSFGCVMFLMNDQAVEYLDNSSGWEVGVGPSIVIMDKGMATNLSTTTGRSDVYAFVFDQKGLMAGIGLQGSKISKINP